MTEYIYDLLVIGSGPGGQSAALQAASLGKRVGLIERKPYLGGVSLQTGTIPSKALREAAYLASRFSSRGMREARQFRDQQHSGFLSEAVSRKQAVIDRHERLLLNQLMSHGVSLLPGEAGFIDAHTLSLRKSNGEVAQLSAAVIVLATGSRPRRPADVPFDKERVLDSTSILQMRRLPQRMTIIGGGVIACEFTTMFAPLGVAVSLIDTHDHLLAYLDADIQQTLEHDLLDMGVQLHMKTRVKRIERHDQRVQLETDSGVIFETDVVLYALGRVPNYDSLKLDAAGIDADDQGWVRINEHHQTSQDHIYIIGDLAGRPSLASTAMEQGRLAMKHAFDRKHAAPAGQLPMAIYTIPELSYVGNTERELQEQGIDYVVGRARFSETARGQIIGEERGFMKLLVDRSSQALLGVHIIGESASELVHIGQMAMNCGAGVNLLASTVYNYPTLAHCYKSAALHCLQQLQA
ncbi:MAG: Si-specific NAD(P)(+) transhydrogenase [Gammaproteobacteria bacterium]|jgi:NAD(P) transhydrogenase|nr:Si-specific NAD(P)(+) transhydrogenase [Gammaproteobacteria bacterium]